MSRREQHPSKSKTEPSTNSAQTHSESPIPARDSNFLPTRHTSQETIPELLVEAPSQTPTVGEVLSRTHPLERERSSPGIPTGIFFQSLNTILYESTNPFATPRAPPPSRSEDPLPKPEPSRTMAGASPPTTDRKPSSRPGTPDAPETAQKPSQPKTPATARKPPSRQGTPSALRKSRKPSTQAKTPTTSRKPSSRPGILGAGEDETAEAILPTPKQPPIPKPPPPTPKTPAAEAPKKPTATIKTPKKAAAPSKIGKAKPDTAGLLDSNIIAAPWGSTGRTTRSAAGTLPKKPERLVNAVAAPDAIEKRERKSKPAPIKVFKPSVQAGKRSGPSPYQIGSTPGRKGSAPTGGKNVTFTTDEGTKIPGRGSASRVENSSSSVRFRPKTPFAREAASSDDHGTGHDGGENTAYCPLPELLSQSEIEKGEQLRKNKGTWAKEKAAVKPWEGRGTGKVSLKRPRKEERIQGQDQGPDRKRKRRGKKHRKQKGTGEAGNKT